MKFIFRTDDFYVHFYKQIIEVDGEDFSILNPFSILPSSLLWMFQTNKQSAKSYLWISIEFSSRLLRACLAVVLYLIIFQKIVWVGFSS